MLNHVFSLNFNTLLKCDKLLKCRAFVSHFRSEGAA